MHNLNIDRRRAVRNPVTPMVLLQGYWLCAFAVFHLRNLLHFIGAN
jgi:hypothetical protein